MQLVFRRAGSFEVGCWTGTVVRAAKFSPDGKIYKKAAVDYGHSYPDGAAILYPFPPPEAVVVLGARVAVAKRILTDAQRCRNRAEARFKTHVGGHPCDPSPDGCERTKEHLAMNGGLALATFNATTLKIEGADVHSLLRAPLLQMVNLFCLKRCLQLWALQEHRCRFGKDPGDPEDQPAHRTVDVDTPNVGVLRYFIQSADEHGSGGLMFVWVLRVPGAPPSPKISFNAVSFRIATAILDTADGPLKIINLHAPHSGHTAHEKEVFERELLEENARTPSSVKIRLTVGDFNLSENGFRLQTLLAGLDAVSAFKVRPPKRLITFIAPNGKWRKQLDHICINKRFQSAFRSFKVLRPPINKNGHLILTACIRVRWAKPAPPPQHFNWLHLSKNNDVQADFLNRIKNQLSFSNAVSWAEIASAAIASAKDIPKHQPLAAFSLRWEEAVESLEAAVFVLSTPGVPKGVPLWNGWLSSPSESSRKERAVQWCLWKARLSEEVRMSNLRELFISTRNPSVQREIENYHLQLAEDVISQECRTLEHNMRRKPATAWKYITRLTASSRVQLQAPGDTPKEKLNKVQRFFQSMGGDVGGDPHVKFKNAFNIDFSLKEVRKLIYDGPITLYETVDSAKMFDRGRCPGSDSLPIECLLVLLSDPLIGQAIVDILNLVLVTGECEETWRLILQLPIPKKGDLSQLSNWRPICLVNAIVKLFNRIIMNRIQPAVERMLRDSQFGFRPNRSTMGAQMTLAEILAKARRAQNGACLCFVDFSKAFPSISFAAIAEALRAFGIPPNLTKGIMALYRGLKGYVRTPDGDTDVFEINTGTLQGDVLAPYLFIMVLDRVLAEALDGHPEGLTIVAAKRTQSRGVLTPAATLTDVDYADDLVLVALSVKDQQTMLTRLSFSALKVNLKINVGPKKTAWMIVGNVEDSNSTLFVEGLGVIPKVDKYRHLGSLRKDTEELVTYKDRLQLTWGAVHRLRPIWRLGVKPEIKLRLFDAMVMPLLIYGASTWVMSRAQLDDADREVHRMRRLVLDVPVYGTNVSSLYPFSLRFSTLQRTERAKNIGHLLRHESPFSLALLWRPSGRKARPLSVSEICARDLHVDADMLIDLAQHRDQWTGRVDDLRHELEPRMMYVPVWSTRWKKAREAALTLSEQQFVEEGNIPFRWFDTELHGYSDGSALKEGERKATGYATIPMGHSLPSSLKPLCAPLLKDGDQTNNRAEIMGAMATVRMAISLNRVAVIHTDSGVVWYWYHHQRRSLRLLKYRTLENSDLWLEFDILLNKCVGHFCIKTRSHNGNPWNEEADLAAGLAARTSSLLRYPGQPLIEGPMHGSLLPFDKSIEVQGRKRAHAVLIKKGRKVPKECRDDKPQQSTLETISSRPKNPKNEKTRASEDLCTASTDERFTIGKSPQRRSKRSAALDGVRQLVTWQQLS